MAAEPRLRPVSSNPEPQAEVEPEPVRRRIDPGKAAALLGIALVIALALLVWSRVQLGSRIDALEDETRVLREAVAERDRVIDAHRGRLGAVRDRVEELQVLLDQPLPSAQ
jgi:hypothetical protein